MLLLTLRFRLKLALVMVILNCCTTNNIIRLRVTQLADSFDVGVR